MTLTLPQLAMLNHATWVQHERSDKRWELKRKREDAQSQQQEEEQEETFNGKKLSEMNSTEWRAYYSGFFSG